MTEATPLASEQITQAGQFLLDRLVDHEVRMTSDDDAREWHGHVTPAMARFRAALSASPAPSGQGVSGDFVGMTAGEAIAATSGNDTLMRDLSFAYVAAQKRMPAVAAVIDRARKALAAPAPSCAPGRTASQCSAQEVELAALLAEVELELRHSRVFIGSREKMHPTGIELYEQLHAKVNAALDALR